MGYFKEMLHLNKSEFSKNKSCHFQLQDPYGCFLHFAGKFDFDFE